MPKTLIIAEKPDMAKAIAQALNVPKSRGCYENDTLIISNAIGHLLEFDIPELAQKSAKLPIIPQQFSLKPIERTAQHYEFLCGLIFRADVALLVNACDADRAGEDIFRRIYTHSGCLKPFKRMWIQSTTIQGLRQAFDNLRDSSEYDNLAAAEQCRAEADWLLGMNGSRAVGNAIGRVMTPTLAMVVDAYQKNQQFKSSNYWEVSGSFAVGNGVFEARLLDENGKIAKFDTLKLAQETCEVAQSSDKFTVSDETETSLFHAPFLFDANELQKAANKKFGYSADKTLEIMQTLYQDFKALTYPRSDFNALPNDYFVTMTETITSLSALPEYAEIIADMTVNGLIEPNSRVFDDARVGSHYAIVPTGFIYRSSDNQQLDLADLSDGELQQILGVEAFNIFNLVALRTLAAFFPAAEYGVTTRTAISGSLKFRTTGRVLQKQGWLAVYGGIDADDDREKSPKLPMISDNETATANDIAPKKLTTKAPPF